MIGRAGAARRLGTALTLAFDDVTPHWLVGGRTGAGKTVFLLNVLYGLAARYSPAELQLYLLDFKEGVCFTEFVPTERDPSWLPHARAVGIESDREYGLAVLRELRREAQRRATRSSGTASPSSPTCPGTIRCRGSWRSSTSSRCCSPATTRWPASRSTCWRSWPARAARTASTWSWPARA